MVAVEHCGSGALWPWSIVAVEHRGRGAPWLCSIMAMEHRGRGAWWLWSIVVVEHGDHGASWQWSTVAVEHGGCGASWPWSMVAVEHHGCGASWLWSTVAVEHGGCGASWLWSMVAVEHRGSGASWPWSTVAVEHHGCGALWLWSIVVVEHRGRGAWWLWSIVAVEHRGCGASWQWSTVAMEHCGHGASWLWSTVVVEVSDLLNVRSSPGFSGEKRSRELAADPQGLSRRRSQHSGAARPLCPLLWGGGKKQAELGTPAGGRSEDSSRPAKTGPDVPVEDPVAKLTAPDLLRRALQLQICTARMRQGQPEHSRRKSYCTLHVNAGAGGGERFKGKNPKHQPRTRIAGSGPSQARLSDAFRIYAPTTPLTLQPQGRSCNIISSDNLKRLKRISLKKQRPREAG
ncbi:Dickkopf-Related Protein 4 [Manis pentadactyla]|nr:Dickkopf-Related Protein 4 [Manis pentadactyla]